MSIAKSWQKKEVRQVGEVVTGKTPSTKKPEYYGDEYKLISPADLDNGKYVTTAHRMLSGLGLEQCRILLKDTVLVGCIGNVGKIGMVADEKAATNQQINAVICNPDHDPHFVYYSLLYNRQRFEKAAVKTTVPILNKSNFKRFDLDIPLFPEQRRIAQVLATVQTAIEQQARLIALMRELKSVLMRKLFTEGLRDEKQKETEIALMPESWDVVCVRDLGEVITGRTPSTKHPEYYHGEYWLISPADLDAGKYVHSAHRNLTKEGFEQCRGLPKETVLVGCIGNIGKIGMTPDDKCATNQQINSIICCESFNPHFVYYCLQFNRTRLENIAAKVTVPIVNKSNFEDFKIASPKKNQQDEISEVLIVLDNKVEILEKKKQTLEELFRTLLHQLMTGQTRV